MAVKVKSATRRSKAQKKLSSTSLTEVEQATDLREVARIAPRAKVKTGKPKRLPKVAAMKLGNAGAGMGGGNIVEGFGGNFYSPELSTDFLELPQSLHEGWNYYRFFYRSVPFVGQALDLHTELPLSKVRIAQPEAKNEALAKEATRFCENWAKRIGLLHRLISIVHEFHLIGEVFIFSEDGTPDMPDEIRTEMHREITEDELVEEEVERKDADERAVKWLKRNYKGFTAVRCLPPEQIHLESFPFTDEKLIELIPDSKSKAIVAAADAGEVRAQRVVDSMPAGVVANIREGNNIPLETDPDAGSFCYYMARKKSDYEERGHSMLERCIRTLVYWDKLRQAQTSIASRHMTPIRIVYAEDMDAADTDALREHVDMALQDPDFSIIANFQITWEEPKGQRLLDLQSEYEFFRQEMFAGLGVTEGLLTGESAYSGDRISLEVINTRYMLLREMLQEFVEQNWFRPMCARMGFVEEDEDGNEKVIYPSLSFTRLALRDNADTFDALFNLYNKGSLPIDIILEVLNIDPVMVKDKLKRDLFTLNDASFNEVLRGLYGELGRKLGEGSDAIDKVATNLGIKYTPPKEEGGRF